MSEPIQLSEIVELKETRDYEEANRLLDAGWCLLATHIKDYGHPVERHQWTVYCLGRPRGDGDPAAADPPSAGRMHPGQTNLAEHPDAADLRALIAGCDDEGGHHTMWVDRDGCVHITQLPMGLTPAQFVQSREDVLFYYETFQQGNGYVGPKAATDGAYVSRLLRSLQQEWETHKGEPGTDYIDIF